MSVSVRFSVKGLREVRALFDRAKRRYALTVRTINAARRRIEALNAQMRTSGGGGGVNLTKRP